MMSKVKVCQKFKKVHDNMLRQFGGSSLSTCHKGAGLIGDNYTRMDITCLYTSSWEFICEGLTDSLTHSLCPHHVGRNYVPLLCGVDTDLRYYVIRDCYLNTVVPLDYI